MAIIANPDSPDTPDAQTSLLEVVISGGQTGADRAGLLAALEVGLSTGGWMPSGFIAHDGPHPEYASLFGIRETVSVKYPSRTKRNVRESDATLRLAVDFTTPGELLTLRMVRQHGRPHFDIDPRDPPSPATAAQWLIDNRVRVLNVAGNAESRMEGLQEMCREYLVLVFRAMVRV